jgi:hypothetical protein
MKNENPEFEKCEAGIQKVHGGGEAIRREAHQCGNPFLM